VRHAALGQLDGCSDVLLLLGCAITRGERHVTPEN
jgi:hypothetical protein